MKGFVAALTVGATLLAVDAVAPLARSYASSEVCEQYGQGAVGGYIVMNNAWNMPAGGQQCIEVTSTGFTITKSPGSTAFNAAPKSYPAVYLGCHYGGCSTDTTLPAQVSALTSLTSKTSVTLTREGVYDAAYDIWLDPEKSPNRVNKTEIMIWLHRQGPVQPVGAKADTVTIGATTYDVWTGNNGQNDVISYLPQALAPGPAPGPSPSPSPTVAPGPATQASFDGDLMAFVNDTLERQKAQATWYLNSVQLGFEPWEKGEGLAVESFSVA